jgi:hypothetical protein
MNELDHSEWSLEQQDSHSVFLTSAYGDITANKKEDGSTE